MDLETIYKNCDYITLHVPQTAETRGMLNEDAFHMMKGGVRILNLARGGLVNDDDMLAALDSGKVACYVTDFPNNKILQGKNVVAIPHLGASTPESEENCAVMAAQQLRDYLENGNITNSVNLVQEGLRLHRGGRGQPGQRRRGKRDPRPGRRAAGAPAQPLKKDRPNAEEPRFLRVFYKAL